jgi:murein L,D-transpeptidase YafK
MKNKVLFVLILIWLLTACAKPSTQTALQNQIQLPPQAVHQVPVQIPDQIRPWVLVDTKAKTLKVMRGNTSLEVFDNVAFGSSGAGIKAYRGDHKTPLGTFRVGWLNEKSRFNYFIGLDYPNLDYAERAHRYRLIDSSTYYAIRSALEQGRTPPQDTPLGGSIGIHGLGAGNPQVHAEFNWTDGCVALDNQQIMRLAQWVGVGTRVVIQ